MTHARHYRVALATLNEYRPRWGATTLMPRPAGLGLDPREEPAKIKE